MENKKLSSDFTFFGKGYFSKKAGKIVPSTSPQGTVDIAWCGRYIKSDRAKWATEELRRRMSMSSDDDLRKFKLLNFEAVAGSGTFKRGCASGLIERSQYIVLDVDDLSSTEEARAVQRTLVADSSVETALCFLSPKGHGTKWWVELPVWCMDMTFSEQYAALSRYVGYEYGIQADLSCSNVNRLCFLPYDPDCFINAKYLSL